MEATQSSAGWYPDPFKRGGGLRWWDGTNWSKDLIREHTVVKRSRDKQVLAVLVLLVSVAIVLFLALSF